MGQGLLIVKEASRWVQKMLVRIPLFQLLFRVAGDFGGEVAFLDFQGAAGFDGIGELVDSGEHQEKTHGRKNTPVNDAHGRDKETTNNQQHTKHKSNSKDAHGFQDFPPLSSLSSP